MSGFRKLDRREFLALTGTASAGVLLLGLDLRQTCLRRNRVGTRITI